jgi:carbamoyltransferase
MKILGISAYYHDSAAAILENGEILAAAQEERFTRKKHDSRFPQNAVEYCLKEARTSLEAVEAVVFYDKPLTKFERLLETYLSYAPLGISSFLKAMPVWLKEKLFLKSTLKKELRKFLKHRDSKLPKLLFAEHHQSHAASAFFPSPFETSAVICLDGVGEWATTSVWLGQGNRLDLKWEIEFPHSLGMLYSAFTYYTGFKVNSGEYKLMGLAPYGDPKYVDFIWKHLIDLKADGTFHLNMEYFNFAVGLTMTSQKFHDLFGGPPREPEGKVTQKEMDLARSIQVVTEEIILKLASTVARELGTESLCLAGGVALNCVANGRLLREGPFKKIWIQPAAGDSGGALGAALSAWHQYYEKPRRCQEGSDQMKGGYLGPALDQNEIKSTLESVGAKYQILSQEEVSEKVAELLSEENVIGWCQGRMEFGPRALGARSILGDPRSQKMQSVMNLKIKHRESFRPFAPAVLEEEVAEYFDLHEKSPYMLLVAPVAKKHQIPMTLEQQSLFGIEKLNIPRSTIPAVTHVDFSARIQTVSRQTNNKFYDLLQAFKKKTGCGVLVNTSFNVRGEPMVASAADAYRCFMRTEMDYLVIENFLLSKKEQPQREWDETWKREFELD